MDRLKRFFAMLFLLSLIVLVFALIIGASKAFAEDSHPPCETDKVLVCVDGVEKCLPPAAADQMIKKGQATKGACPGFDLFLPIVNFLESE